MLKTYSEKCFLFPVSPTIAGSGPEGSAEEVTVTLSSPTSLLCEVQSYPPALITWLKDGTPFESSRNVRVLPGLPSLRPPKCSKFEKETATSGGYLLDCCFCHTHAPS